MDYKTEENIQRHYDAQDPNLSGASHEEIHEYCLTRFENEVKELCSGKPWPKNDLEKVLLLSLLSSNV